MSRSALTLFVSTALGGLVATCSSGYEMGEPVNVPEPTNALANSASTEGTADVSVSTDTTTAEPGMLGCEADTECEGMVTLNGPCEAATCDLETGQCAATPLLDLTPCVDEDPCATQTVCTEGVCLGVPVDCDDGNPCTDEVCDPTDGCVPTPNDATCDDGNPCTEDDACVEGACAGQATAACGCEIDLDCATWDDDDLCNGQLRCLDGQCDIDPITVVTCDPSGDTDCSAAQCEPTTGACSPVSAEDGSPCNDGNPCTADDTCADGACTPGPSVCECEADTDCASFEDGDLCNGTPVCAGNECVTDPDTVISCDDVPPTCMVFECVADTGACELITADEGVACDDGLLCTVSDACFSGECLGAMKSCDDGNPCTIDGCDPVEGCTSWPTTGICDDDDPCTINDACLDGVCGGTPMPCDDGDPCTDDACNDTGVCVHVTYEGPCDDGDPCTIGDKCLIGSCLGVADTCDDGVACTVDTCVQGQGCESVADDTLCNDASACTVGVCDFLGGCKQTPNPEGTPCNDYDACTLQDTCQVGLCVGVEASCDDGNPCTDDACDVTAGCTTTPNALACDDGDPCTESDSCHDGTCDGAKIPGCGEPVCGDGLCTGWETCQSCVGDCGACPTICGDGLCDMNEDCNSCPLDCGGCGAICGDWICDATENCSTCPTDCGGCPTGTCLGSCGGSDLLGNCYCDALCFELGDCCPDICNTCPMDYPLECSGGGMCGDGQCNGAETCQSCATDCGPCDNGCGDGVCDAFNNELCYTCPADCGACSSLGSCAGMCNSAVSAGDCWCDTFCFGYGDCCTDVCTSCGSDFQLECAIP